MKIAHVTQEMFRTSGVATFCREVAHEQMRAGHKVFVLVCHDYDLKFDEGIAVTVGGSLDLIGVVPDVVHIHGLWAPFSVRAIAWCRKRGVPYVVSPHGCLMPRVFRKGWIKKHLFWWLMLRGGVRKADLIHCTAEPEREAIARLGFDMPTVIAPVGVRVAEVAQGGGHREKGKRMALFIGRISDEKGLPLLLDAWKALASADWRLVIAGPDWRGHRAELEKKIIAEKITGVEFHDSVFGAEKDALYRVADLFVLASPVENFSAVVLDALAAGVPVICTRGTPWDCIEREKCGWWVEANSSAAILQALESANALTRTELQEMGRRGIAIAKRDYNWATIARTLAAGYERTLACRSGSFGAR